MKTNIGKVGLAAAFVLALPLASIGQNSSRSFGSAGAKLDRFTLLTGPSLLSAPHGSKLPKAEGLTERPLFDPLRVGAEPKSNQLPTDPFPLPVPTTKSTPPPSPETLHFNSTLHPAPTPPRIEFQATKSKS